MEIKQIERLADEICAELLISKHSENYQQVVKTIGSYFEPKLMIMFDQNNIPYNPNLSNDIRKETIMSVLREELVSTKSAVGSFIAHTMNLERDFKSEAEALKIFLKETEKLEVLFGDTAEIINDRLETLERKDDGAV